MKNIFLLLSLFLFACTAAKKAKSTVQTETFLNVKIDEGKKGDAYGPCEPSICVSPTNTKNVAAGAILDRNYWSEDGGKTWKSGHLKSTFGVFGDPVLIADRKGDFYYAHLSDPSGKGWASETILDRIVIQKSTDGGKTYNNGSFTGAHHPKDQDKHWLVADPKSDAIYCSWTEFDKYNSHDLENDHSRILFSKSEDAGKTWAEPVILSQLEGDCEDDDLTTEGAVPAVGNNGEVYVAWAFNSKIYFDRSTDGGKTWLKEDIVAADQPGGWTFDIPGITRCNGMPVLVCDNSNGPNRGTLYLNWGDLKNGENDADIWLSKSTDNGNTWSKPKRVNDDKKGKQQFLTWLAIDQTNGNLYIMFYDRRNYEDERTDVYVATSTDGGKSFRNLKISETPFDPNKNTFFGDYNHISAHGGVVRPIWTRMVDAKLSIWTAIMDFPTEKK
jgi:Neuraminidase (sialidase)